MTNEEILTMLPKAAYFTIAPISCCYRGSDKRHACDEADSLVKNGYCPEMHVVECLLDGTPPKVIASYPKQPTPKVGQIWRWNDGLPAGTVAKVVYTNAKYCVMEFAGGECIVLALPITDWWTFVSEPTE